MLVFNIEPGKFVTQQDIAKIAPDQEINEKEPFSLAISKNEKKFVVIR